MDAEKTIDVACFDAPRRCCSVVMEIAGVIRLGGPLSLRHLYQKALTFITYKLSFLALRTCTSSLYILRFFFFGLRCLTHLTLLYRI